MTTQTTDLQLCTFWLGDLYLGVDVLGVQEVLYKADITPVPHANTSISGLINLRGQIATTINLRERLDIDPAPENTSQTHVVVTAAGESVSLIVDRIGDVVDVNPQLFETPPETMTGIARDLIAGAYKLDDGLLLILDVDKTVLGSHHTTTGTTQ